MSHFADWGFSEDPFLAFALPADERGLRLLVGRDAELRRLKQNLRASARPATLEGPNGVGKTSLANVAVYSCLKDFREEGVGQLLLPCGRPFQLSAAQRPAEIATEVLLEVAQTLVLHARFLCDLGRRPPGLEALERWMNRPVQSASQFSLEAPGIGGGFGRSAQVNEAVGFERAGLRHAVLEALAGAFPAGSGAVVVVLDNLELVETSQAARRLLEELRDELLLLPGVRWIIAGAAGIVDGAATSPRLEGFLQAPIAIRGLGPELAQEILNARIDVFRVDDESEPYLPLLTQDFGHLSRVLARNTRSALGRAANYCSWIADSGRRPASDDDKHSEYLGWLERESRAVLEASERLVGAAAKAILRKAAAEFDGLFSPSDFPALGLNSPQNLRPKVKELEDAGLVTSARDDADQRRKTIQISAKGWLALFAQQLEREETEVAE